MPDALRETVLSRTVADGYGEFPMAALHREISRIPEPSPGDQSASSRPDWTNQPAAGSPWNGSTHSARSPGSIQRETWLAGRQNGDLNATGFGICPACLPGAAGCFGAGTVALHICGRQNWK